MHMPRASFSVVNYGQIEPISGLADTLYGIDINLSLNLATGLVRLSRLPHWRLVSASTDTALLQRALGQLSSLSSARVASRQLSSGTPVGQWSSKVTHPLQEEKPRQFLTSDKETIVCVHPIVPADISDTKVSITSFGSIWKRTLP